MARSKVITVNHVGAGAAARPFLAGPSCLPHRSLGLTTRPPLRASSDQRGSRANSEYPPLLLRAYRHHVWQAWLGHSYFSAGPHAFAVARQSLCLAQREFQRPAILAELLQIRRFLLHGALRVRCRRERDQSLSHRCLRSEPKSVMVVSLAHFGLFRNTFRPYAATLSALGHKRTKCHVSAMSALPSKADTKFARNP
jgi:hypothetical protein